jgi:hypothetical protein
LCGVRRDLELPNSSNGEWRILDGAETDAKSFGTNAWGRDSVVDGGGLLGNWIAGSDGA